MCHLPEKGRKEIVDIVEEIDWLIVLGFNDTSTLVGHFVSSPRERETEEIVEEMKKKDRGERKMIDSEETEEIKTFPLYPNLLQG